MRTGKKFKLEQNILALGTVDGNRRAIIIPAGAVVKVVSDSAGDGNQMLDVFWERQILTVFAYDVDVHGTEIAEPERHILSARA
jgi:hypothetical protein